MSTEMLVVWMLRCFAAALLVGMTVVVHMVVRTWWRNREGTDLIFSVMFVLLTVAVSCLNVLAWRMP